MQSCRTLVKTVILRTIVYIIYGLVGAFVFIALEEKQERDSSHSRQLLNQLHKRLNVWCKNLTVAEFNRFVMAAHNALQLQLQADWNYVNAIHFVYQATTTIGYGEITPTTPAGQGFCMIYCLVGIPLALAALKATGELLSYGFCHLIKFWEKKILGHTIVKNLETKCAVVAFTVMLVHLGLTSVVAMFVDEIGFVQSIYSSFITYTTIGFGDYIPFSRLRRKAVEAGDHGAILMTVGSVFATFISIFGLGVMSSVLNSLLSAIYANRKKSHRKQNKVDKYQRNVEKIKNIFLERESNNDLLLCLRENTSIKADIISFRKKSI